MASSLSCSCAENGGWRDICFEVIGITVEVGAGLDNHGEAHDGAHWVSKDKCHKAAGLHAGKATNHQ